MRHLIEDYAPLKKIPVEFFKEMQEWIENDFPDGIFSKDSGVCWNLKEYFKREGVEVDEPVYSYQLMGDAFGLSFPFGFTMDSDHLYIGSHAGIRMRLEFIKRGAAGEFQ